VKRVFDFIMALFLLSFLSVPILIIALMVKLTSKGPVLYWSDRVGMDNRIFGIVPKLRDTPPRKGLNPEKESGYLLW